MWAERSSTPTCCGPSSFKRGKLIETGGIGSLPFPLASFDMVVHCDTLEHVVDQFEGLHECQSVLADPRALVFTVSDCRSAEARPEWTAAELSWGSHTRDSSIMVNTEFGADVWTLVTRAGELVSFRFPTGLANVARR